ncbi:MAG: hypothetical protein HGA78_05575, partial [Nitrospirales bacterium]|nr:hypothetical protein [Nitrospirales bacterium]
MKLKKKLTILILFLSLIPLFLLSLMIYQYFQASLLSFAKNQLISIASIQEARVNAVIDKYLLTGSLMASRTRLRILAEAYVAKGDRTVLPELTGILRDARKGTDITEVSVLDLKGAVIASTQESEIGRDYSGDDIFLKGKKECTLIDIVGKGGGKDCSVLTSCPLMIEGRLIGVVLIRDSVASLWDITDDYTGLGESGETTLAKRDRKGDALYITPVRFRADAAMKLTIPQSETERTMSRALSGDATYIGSAPDYRGVEVSAVTRRIARTGWGLTVEIDKAEEVRPLRHLVVFLVFGFFFLSAGLAATAIYFARRITAPVTELEKAVRRIILEIG